MAVLNLFWWPVSSPEERQTICRRRMPGPYGHIPSSPMRPDASPCPSLCLQLVSSCVSLNLELATASSHGIQTRADDSYTYSAWFLWLVQLDCFCPLDRRRSTSPPPPRRAIRRASAAPRACRGRRCCCGERRRWPRTPPCSDKRRSPAAQRQACSRAPRSPRAVPVLPPGPALTL